MNAIEAYRKSAKHSAESPLNRIITLVRRSDEDESTLFAERRPAIAAALLYRPFQPSTHHWIGSPFAAARP